MSSIKYSVVTHSNIKVQGILKFLSTQPLATFQTVMVIPESTAGSEVLSLVFEKSGCEFVTRESSFLEMEFLGDAHAGLSIVSPLMALTFV